MTKFDEPADVIVFDGFKDMDEAALKELYGSLNLAMTFKDFLHIQNYFKSNRTTTSRYQRYGTMFHIIHSSIRT